MLQKKFVTTSGFTSTEEQWLKETIEELHGTYETQLTEQTSLLVANYALSSSKFIKAHEAQIPTVCANFIYKLASGECLYSDLGSYRVSLFHGLVFSTTGYEEESVSHIKTIVVRNGGIFSQQFTCETTHLVAEEMNRESSKCSYARNRGVTIVNYKSLRTLDLNSMLYQRRSSTCSLAENVTLFDQFVFYIEEGIGAKLKERLRQLIVTRGGIRVRRMGLNVTHGLFSTHKNGYLFYDWVIRSVERGCCVERTERRVPLAGLRVFFNPSGCSSRLEELVTELGGEVVGELKSATHCAYCGQAPSLDYERLVTQTKGRSLHVVSPEWIRACSKSVSRIREEEYPVLKKTRILDKKENLTAPDYIEIVEDPQSEPEVVAQLSNLPEFTRTEAVEVFRRLSVRINPSSSFCAPTFLVCGAPSKSEKFLCALASGTPILKPTYVNACAVSNALLPFESHQWNPQDAEVPSHERLLLAHAARIRSKQKAFFSLKVSIHCDERRRGPLKRLLESGGATITSDATVLFVEKGQNTNIENTKVFFIDSIVKLLESPVLTID